MNPTIKNIFLRLTLFSVLVLVIIVPDAFGFKVRGTNNALEEKEFRNSQLYIGTSQVPVADIINSLSNKAEWQLFSAKYKDAFIYFDPRSGRPVSIMYPVPLIPGKGTQNNVTLESVSTAVGYRVKAVTEREIKALILNLLREHTALVRISMDEVGEIRIGNPSETMWHVQVRRQVNGIPVRDANISFTIKHGNIVFWGLEKWGDVTVDTKPVLSSSDALQAGFNFINGRRDDDTIIVEPHLELVPFEPAWDGTVGKGYGYELAWIYTFQRKDNYNTWEVIVDAHDGKLLSFSDTNMYATKKIVGAIYPVSSDGCCPDGCASQSPAPFINTGFTSPNNFTNFGGLYTYSSGTATTTLDGKYVVIGSDSCGSISESSATGDIDLGGANAQHDCTIPNGHSAGDTFSSRSCAIEVTHLNRQVASWLNLGFLDGSITCNVNINDTCNAYYSGNTINFFLSGGGCRNTGEIAAVFDHEWGHAVDYADSAGGSSPNEAISDIAAAMRLHTSCVGRGFWWTYNLGCGQWKSCPTNPGVAFGYNCDGYNSSECCTGCTGIREIDYMKHTGTDADTVQNYVCSICSTSGGYFGPCGREAHCEGVPSAMVGWDLAARDLMASPFSLDKQSAFTIADKIIWQGHNNVTNWYSCTCPSTVNSCGASNAYPNWLAADDDDGNVNNGTPHMTAIYAAHNRHGTACATPPRTNHGCSSGPATAPALSAAPGNNSVLLSWSAVSGAANYYVFRTEGVMGCDFGKEKIATVSTTSYTDAQAMNGRTYYYSVMPVGANTDCVGPLSNCVQAVPTPGPHVSFQNSTFTDSCPGGGTGNGNGVIDPGERIIENITVANDGNAPLTGISGTLTTTTPGISFPDNVALFPDITVDATGASLSPYFAYELGSTIVCGTALNFNLAMNFAQGSNSTSFSHVAGLLTQNIVLQQNFSTGNPPSGWIVVDGGSGGGSAATWTTANPGGRSLSAPFSAPFMIVDSDYATSSATQDEQLITPLINVSGCSSVILEFSSSFRDWDVQIGDVDISTNGGTSFPTNVLRLQGGDYGYPTPETRQINITSAVAPNPTNVKIRFHYYNASYEYWWAIDNVKVSCINYACTVCAPAPEIDVTPTFVSFDNVVVGNTADRIITVMNTGKANLNITAVSVPASPFSIIANSCTGLPVPANGNCTITVQFNASTANIYTGSFTISSNDYNEASYQVNLWGAAVSYVMTPQSVALNSNTNGVIDIGEASVVAPSWTNESSSDVSSVTGGATTPDSGVVLEVTANYGNIAVGATVSCLSTGDCYGVTANGPRPTTHWDVNLRETLSTNHIKNWQLHIGNSFNDVPVSNLFYFYIESLLHSGVTAGCTTNEYCPNNTVLRSHMAKFICAAMQKKTPGTCATASCAQLFTDVPASNPFCPYIESLYNSGVVAGCQSSPLMYCPSLTTVRQAMAKFICMGMEAATPGSCPTASCAGIFGDVTSSNPFCSYIEALYNVGVISGCQSSPLLYCPSTNVNRAQMGKFLINAFDFPLY